MGLADQLASSASNIVIVIAIARVAPVETFGNTLILFAVVTTAVAILRGCIGTPLSLTSGRSHAVIMTEAGYALSLSAVTGLLIGGALLLYGAYTGVLAVALPFAVATPVVLAQDGLRFSSTALGRPHLALASDGLWCVGSVSGLAISWIWRSEVTTAQLAWIWAFSAAAALLCLALLTHTSARVSGLVSWLRASLLHRSRFALEAAIGAAAPLLIASGAALLIGAQATAALRGSSTLLGPLSVLISALSLAAVPELVRESADTAQAWRRLRTLAIGMSILAVVLTVGLFFLPAAVGTQLLGPSWSVVRPLLPITGTEYFFFVWTSCYFTALRAAAMSAQLLKSRAIYSALLACLSIAAGWAFETAAAMAIAQATVAAAMAVTFATGIRVQRQRNSVTQQTSKSTR